MPFGAMASSEAYPSFLVCIFLHVDGWLKPYDLLGWFHNDDVAVRVASAWQRRGYWTAVLEIGLHVAFQAPTDVSVDPSPGPLPCGAMIQSWRVALRRHDYTDPTPTLLVCIFADFDGSGWLEPRFVLGWYHTFGDAQSGANQWLRRGYYALLVDIPTQYVFQAPPHVQFSDDIHYWL